MNKIGIRTLLALLVGVGIGISTSLYFGESDSSKSSSAEKQPLYWVAPMDPNYRRDEPGKSPMGMDLVPVYEESGSQSPGVIRINPDVVNNLGVRSAAVEMGAINQSINTTGVVQYNEANIVHIHPRVEGWIEKLHVKATGNPVKKGQPLYDLYSPQLVNAQEEFISSLKSDNEQLIQSSLNNLRALDFPKDFINQLRTDRRVKRAVTFNAPASGVLESLDVRDGYFVGPSIMLMSIVNLDQVWVEAEVLQAFSENIKAGLPAKINLDKNSNTFWNGEIDYVYPSADIQNRSLRLRLVVDNPQHILKANMFTRVKINLPTIENRVRVPRSAVIHLGDEQRVVKHLGDGQYKSIAIQTGESNKDFIEIKQGVKAGEEVVVSAQFLLDSESSKSSDFKRIDHGTDTSLPNAAVMGIVNSVNVRERTINISREAIEKWNRPKATLDFLVAPNVPQKILTNLAEGAQIHFIFVIDDGDFIVTEIHPMDDHGEINHTEEQDVDESHGEHQHD